MFSHAEAPKRIQGGFYRKSTLLGSRYSRSLEPKRENPILVFPVLGKPVQENLARLNTNIYQVRRCHILSHYILFPLRCDRRMDGMGVDI